MSDVDPTIPGITDLPLRQQLATIKIEIEALEASGPGGDNPDLTALQAQADANTAAIATNTDDIEDLGLRLDNLRARVASNEARLDDLESRVDVLEGGGGSPPPIEDFTLASGGNLPAAIASASSGDTIILEGGGTYDIPSRFGNGGKSIEIRTQLGAATRATVRAGDGTGDYVHVTDAQGRWRWLPQIGRDITANEGDPVSGSYVGPHLTAAGDIVLTGISTSKSGGEDFNDWPGGAVSGDYEVLRGSGIDGFEVEGGAVTLRGIRFHSFDKPFFAFAGNLILEDCVVIGAKTMFDMEGGNVTLRDSLFFGGAQNSWTWREVKSGALDPVGKRTLAIPRNAGGTITIRRCTMLDFYDLIVASGTTAVIDIDQMTMDGRTDDLEQMDSNTRGDMTVRRCKVRGTSIGGNITSSSINTNVTRIFEDSIVTNFRELLDYGVPRWRILMARHNQPRDPATIRRVTFIERGGVNVNEVPLNFVFGAPWYGSSARPQVWEDVCLVMETSTGNIARDYELATAGGLEVSNSAILNISGGSLGFDNGLDFNEFFVDLVGDTAAEQIDNNSLTFDDIWADPRLISQEFGRKVGAISGNATNPFGTIGDPNDWGFGL